MENLICDGKFSQDSWGAARLPYDQAKLHARLGQKKQMYQNLKIAAKAAEASDHRPEIQSYFCSLLGTVEKRVLDFETDDSRTLCERMRDKWLENAVFDAYRSEVDFQEIISQLTAGIH